MLIAYILQQPNNFAQITRNRSKLSSRNHRSEKSECDTSGIRPRRVFGTLENYLQNKRRRRRRRRRGRRRNDSLNITQFAMFDFCRLELILKRSRAAMCRRRRELQISYSSERRLGQLHKASAFVRNVEQESYSRREKERGRWLGYFLVFSDTESSPCRQGVTLFDGPGPPGLSDGNFKRE